MKGSGSERRMAILLVVVTLVLFAGLWFAIDLNVFSGVRGAP